MIILEHAQLPKLDQVHFPADEGDARGAVRRPASALSTSTLPDYEASQKAHLLPPSAAAARARSRFYPLSPFRRSKSPPSRSRRCLLIVYYVFLAYAIIGSVVLVPVLVWKAKSSDAQVDSYQMALQDPPPSLGIPLYDNKHINMVLTGTGNVSLQCNAWTSGPSVMRDGVRFFSSSLNYTFPLSPSIRLSSDDDASGTLIVELNPDETASDVVFSASVQYSDLDLFQNSSLCVTRATNITAVNLMTPEHASDTTLTANLTLLLPRSSQHIPEFATYVPNFEQRVGSLSPSVTFSNVALEGSHEPISFGSIAAETLVVKTAYAKVSGNLNVTGALSIDTVTAPIEVTIYLANNATGNYPTTATLDTGNAPLLTNLILSAPSSPASKRAQFLVKASTFNAPLNLSVSHAPGTSFARTYVHGITAAGPLALDADALFAGTFDLSTKAASVIVQHQNAHTNGTSSSSQSSSSSSKSSSSPSSGSSAKATATATATATAHLKARGQTACAIDFDYKAPGRALGWAGQGARTDDQSHLMLETSLGQVTLDLYDTRGVPGVVPWATTSLG